MKLKDKSNKNFIDRLQTYLGKGVENEVLDDSIYKKYNFFPFWLVAKNDKWWNIVIGVKGDGKTFGKLLYYIYINQLFGGEKYCVEIVETKDKIKEIIADANFFDRLMIKGNDEKQEDESIIEFLNSLEFRNSAIYSVGKKVVQFIPKSGGDKNKDKVGAKVHTIIEDECFRDRYIKNEVYNLTLILDTLFRKRTDIKFIQLGNAVSLSHPLFVAFDIYKLDDNKITTEIKDDEKQHLGNIWNWKREEQEIEKSYGTSPLFKFMKKTGYAEFAFKNVFKNDNLSNIIPIEFKDLNKYEKKYNVELNNGTYATFYEIDEKYNSSGENIFYLAINKKLTIDDVEIAIAPEYVEDNIVLRLDYTKKLALLLQQNKIFYQNVVVKKYLYEILKNFFWSWL